MELNFIKHNSSSMKNNTKGGIQFELTMDGDNWDLSYLKVQRTI